MKAPSDVFQLIQSLSKTEKAYFKKYSSAFPRGAGNSYLRLFDAIEQQKEYNEEALLVKFKGEKFLRQFPVAKNYLYGRLLEAMRSYHTSPMKNMNGLSEQAAFLFEKGLYKQSDKLLARAEKKAERDEQLSAFIFLEEQLRFDHFMKRKRPRLAEKSIEAALHEIPRLINQLEYQKLLAGTQRIYNAYGKNKNPRYLKELRDILRHPLLKNESCALSFSARRRFFDIHAVYNSVIEKHEASLRFSLKIIDLYDRHPEKKNASPIVYAGYISNALLFSSQQRLHGKTEALLKKLADLRPALQTRHQKARFFEIYYNNLLNHCNETGSFHKAEKLLPEIQAGIAEHGNRLTELDHVMLQGEVARTYFGLEQYKNCLRTVNRIRNEWQLKIRPDFEGELHLLNILVHYELKHYDLLPHLASAYERFLKSKNMITPMARHFSAWVRKYASVGLGKDLLQTMGQLKKQLGAKEEKKEAGQQGLVSINIWLESKLLKKRFSELVEVRSKKERI